VLLRGHEEPGGGFAGGLVAAAAVILRGVAYEPQAARAVLRFNPHVWVGAGLLLCLVTSVVSLLAGGEFLEAQRWFNLDLGSFKISIGTALLFDAGVYLGVVGAVVGLVTRLLEE
jgi:multicomponent Na+:H+ antiporter subunit B